MESETSQIFTHPCSEQHDAQEPRGEKGLESTDERIHQTHEAEPRDKAALRRPATTRVNPEGTTPSKASPGARADKYARP